MLKNKLIKGGECLKNILTNTICSACKCMIIADLNLCALCGVHLRFCKVLHGYCTLGRTSRPTTKAAGSEALL